MKIAAEWYANEIGKTVEEFDEYDLYVSKVALKYAREYLILGVPVMQLNGWQTVKEYAKSKGLTTNVVSNWIARNNGKVEVRKYPELNGLVLVKEKTQN